MSENKDLIQFKLSSGAEVICEVLEWNSAVDPDCELIVKNALSVITWDHQDGERSYIFRPWVSFPDAKTDFVILNPNHIISMNKPGDYISGQYYNTIEDLKDYNLQRDLEFDEKRKENLKKFHEILTQISNLGKDSSDHSNIIQFPVPPDKIH